MTTGGNESEQLLIFFPQKIKTGEKKFPNEKKKEVKEKFVHW